MRSGIIYCIIHLNFRIKILLMYIWILNKNNLLIKSLFLLIWFFFIFRITSYINFHNHILQQDSKKWIFFLADISSSVIAIVLFIYLLISLKNYKKISINVFLIIYPIFGLTGYLLNEIKNQYQDIIIWHHFITLSSAFLFFSIIENKKIFDYQFKELLLKIFLIIIFLYFLINIFPTLAIGFYSKQDLRITQKILFSVFDNQFYLLQNVNGSTRICVILLIISFLLFKKFIFERKIMAHIFFLIGLLLIIFIYIMQSRFNILATLFFSFFLLLSIKSLNLKKKLFYFLIILIFPLVISNIYSKHTSRFKDHVTYIDYQKVFLQQSDIFRNSLSRAVKKSYYGQNNIVEIIEQNKDNIVNLSTKNFLILNNFIITNNNIPFYNHNEVLHLVKRFLVLHAEAKLSECSHNLNYFDRLLTGRICGWEILLKNIKINDFFLGKGFLFDQVYLKYMEKTSSNSWMNILFNAGIIALLVYLIFIFIILSNFFKIKNINDKNIYISISHYLFIYFLLRSLFEDTLAFLSVDFLLFFISISIIKETKKKII